jgi:hypothetical protein
LSGSFDPIPGLHTYGFLSTILPVSTGNAWRLCPPHNNRPGGKQPFDRGKERAGQNLDRFAQRFSQEFSGLRARRIVSQLTQLHRIQASPGLSAAVDLMHQAAEAAGLANVQVHRYPVDGKSYWWTWKKPWFWSPQSAELRLIAPEEEVLARLWRNSAALRTSRVAWALFAPRPRREASPLKWQT